MTKTFKNSLLAMAWIALLCGLMSLVVVLGGLS